MTKQALSKIKQYRKLGLEKTFKERMFFWGSIIAGISFIALWVNSFYYQAPVSEIISFMVEDSWCPETNSGIGLHCFGDYYSPVAGFSMENPWADGYAYTPIAHQQFVPFDFLGRMFDTPRVGLLAYLLTGFISLLLPLIWAGRTNFHTRLRDHFWSFRHTATFGTRPWQRSDVHYSNPAVLCAGNLA